MVLKCSGFVELYYLNNQHSTVKVSRLQCYIGWLIHAFTASGACFGLLALLAIYQHQLLSALWYMGATILIDAVDGIDA